MNLLGKIFTFLILLTSVAFCVVAVTVVASHQDWKSVAKENADEAKRLKTVAARAQEQVAALEISSQKEKVARAMALAQLNSQLSIAEDRYKTTSGQVQDLSSKLNDASTLLKEAEARLKQQDTQVDTLQAQNKVLVENLAKQASRVAQVLAQVEAAEVKKSQLSSQLDSMMSEFNELKKVTDVLGVDKNTLVAQTPPDLNGRVTSVSARQNDVFAVSLGMDDGLREGHVVDVVRGGRHIGTAKITMSKPNHATARFVKGMRNSAVEVGDSVTTTLAKRLTTSLSSND